jgi:hypothetical protein
MSRKTAKKATADEVADLKARLTKLEAESDPLLNAVKAVTGSQTAPSPLTVENPQVHKEYHWLLYVLEANQVPEDQIVRNGVAAEFTTAFNTAVAASYHQVQDTKSNYKAKQLKRLEQLFITMSKILTLLPDDSDTDSVMVAVKEQAFLYGEIVDNLDNALFERASARDEKTKAYVLSLTERANILNTANFPRRKEWLVKKHFSTGT